MAVCYEEAGRSLFGPLAFNCQAPDDANMMVLGRVATEAQKERWLQPIVDGAVRSAFQLMGAKGYSRDTPLEWMYRYARQARLVDGASEVHKMVLSRMLAHEGADFWAWRT